MSTQSGEAATKSSFPVGPGVPPVLNKLDRRDAGPTTKEFASADQVQQKAGQECPAH